MQGKGVRSIGAGIDWAELMRFKRSFTDPVPARKEANFAEAGIMTFHGRGRFIGPRTIQVGDEVLEGRYLVVATGAEPRQLGIPGVEHVTTSDQFLELPELPPRLLFIGGGYISVELAHVAIRAGVQVTILHRGARPLAQFDPDLVEQLLVRTRELGIAVHVDTEVTGIERGSGGLNVWASVRGRSIRFDTDLVVHGAGRVPAIADLALETAGVRHAPKGVEVNEYLQSVSNPAVFAAGDAAASGPPLTPVAGTDGEIVADNLLHGNHRTTNYRVVPSVVFTVPPLADVGLSEQQAQAQGCRFRVHRENTANWYSSRRIGETCSGSKVLIEEDTTRILGAHLLGTQAEEVINLFTLAIKHGLQASDLTGMMFAYPTHASDIWYMV
jgi:glutathione reductase (NADPH)